MDGKNAVTEMPLEVLEKLGEVRTDSDVMDMAEEYGIPINKLDRYIAERTAPKCCKGCAYVVNGGGFSPCTECTRNKRDYYTPFHAEEINRE